MYTILMTVPATPLNNAQPGGPFSKMKPAKTFNEQISILRSRGLIIVDDKLEKILKKYPLAKLENIGFPDKWENYFK